MRVVQFLLSLFSGEAAVVHAIAVFERTVANLNRAVAKLNGEIDANEARIDRAYAAYAKVEQKGSELRAHLQAARQRAIRVRDNVNTILGES